LAGLQWGRIFGEKTFVVCDVKNSKIPATRKRSSRTSVRKDLTSSSGVVTECWCGDSHFVPFGPDYLECQSCGTLVSQKGLSSAELQVVDDEHDYYGKSYWLDHQQQDFDYPGLETRVRSDLPERNLHWLKTLLKYRLPTAKVMELGCAHGSFVALMQQAGYSASGVEMSPWIVAFGRKTFGIEVYKGPVEELAIDAGSLDVIALMDVMEHLPDPVVTMSRCLDLLKPDGLLLVQMPNFQEGMQYEELVLSNSTFLSQLKSDEHLYLYSKRATVEFFHRLGADHIQFEPAIFAHYDMFFAVSRMPLQGNTPAQIEGALEASPSGRLVLAMLDMKDRYDQEPGLRAEVAASSGKLQELFVRADEFSNARNLLQAQFADLQRNFEAVEKDRAARGEVIEAQGRTVSELQGQVDLRLKELHALFPQMEEWKNLAQSREAELANLTANFAAVEKDRAARGEVIEAQGRSISELQGQVDCRLKELHALFPQMEEWKNLAQSREAELTDLIANFAAVEKDRAARGEVIEAQGRTISELQGQVDFRLRELSELYLKLDEIAHAHQNTQNAVVLRDGIIEAARHQTERLENVAAFSTKESQELRESLEGLALDVQQLRDSLSERENAYQRDVGQLEGQMQALARRWWWKLGKLIKAL
jgi:2-polyprenyl-3-methyl-5-hydroxy-6-metoxy-1,4-benzoquinol methylase/predicted  nucleic acid-binding Zn-ribbon protein